MHGALSHWLRTSLLLTGYRYFRIDRAAWIRVGASRDLAWIRVAAGRLCLLSAQEGVSGYSVLVGNIRTLETGLNQQKTGLKQRPDSN